MDQGADPGRNDGQNRVEASVQALLELMLDTSLSLDLLELRSFAVCEWGGQTGLEGCNRRGPSPSRTPTHIPAPSGLA